MARSLTRRSSSMGSTMGAGTVVCSRGARCGGRRAGCPPGRCAAHDHGARAGPPQGCVEHADLSSVVGTLPCNDMAVDGQGRAYVGNFGYDLMAGAPQAGANLAVAFPDGSVEVAARDLMFPNGTIVTPDGRTLIVAETM